MIFIGIISLITAMAVTWTVTPWVIRLACRMGAIDRPDPRRKMHVAPVPRIGGVAVFAGFAAGMVMAAWLTGNLQALPSSGIDWGGMAIAATALFLVGLWDDLRGLSFQWKFLAQVTAAIYVWAGGFRIDVISHPLGGNLELGWLSLLVTVFWIVAITNAVNLIDGLDGLAAGVALITTAAVGIFSLVRGDLGVTAASVTLAGSLVGFLVFNFNPARIFLGDSGSLFLGFVLAVTSVRGSQKGPTAVAILLPLLVLGLPLLDTSLAVLRRLYRLGTRGVQSDGPALRYVVGHLNQVFLPDRGHIHHRLIDLGFSHRGAVLTLYAVGVLFATAALALVLWKSLLLGLLLITVLLALMAVYFVFLYLRIGRNDGTPESPAPPGAERAMTPEPLAPDGSRLGGR